MDECCTKKENLERFGDTTRPDIIIKRCKVCGRNHYRMIAQPVSMGAKLPTK